MRRIEVDGRSAEQIFWRKTTNLRHGDPAINNLTKPWKCCDPGLERLEGPNDGTKCDGIRPWDRDKNFVGRSLLHDDRQIGSSTEHRNAMNPVPDLRPVIVDEAYRLVVTCRLV